MMKPHLIILGAPGSGKGTQAARLVEKGFKHVSTGDLLRNEISKGTNLGQTVADIISKGNLVDDKTVMALLKANCNVNEVSYIFDGFPRNVAQAKMLDAELLSGKDTLAIYFKIDLNVLIDRVVNRRTCGNCGEIYNLISKKPKIENVCDKCGAVDSLKQRKDDTVEVVSNRLQIFKETVDPMLDFYKSKNALVVIDASMEPDKVFEELRNIISL